MSINGASLGWLGTGRMGAALARRLIEAGTGFLEFLNGTVVSSDWVRKRAGDLVARDWTPTFTTELLRKDFDLGLRHEDFLSLCDQQARVAGLVPEPEG